MQTIDRPKAFHTSANGDRWSLGCDPGTGRAFVLHEPGEAADRAACEIEVGSFLVLCRGPEQDALLTLIGSLVSEPGARLAEDAAPEEEEAADAAAAPLDAARRATWLPRWPAA